MEYGKRLKVFTFIVLAILCLPAVFAFCQGDYKMGLVGFAAVLAIPLCFCVMHYVDNGKWPWATNNE